MYSLKSVILELKLTIFHGKENGRHIFSQRSNSTKLMKIDTLDCSVFVSTLLATFLTYLLILRTADIVCFKLKNNVITDLGARSGMLLSAYVFEEVILTVTTLKLPSYVFFFSFVWKELCF